MVHIPEVLECRTAPTPVVLLFDLSGSQHASDLTREVHTADPAALVYTVDMRDPIGGARAWAGLAHTSSLRPVAAFPWAPTGPGMSLVGMATRGILARAGIPLVVGHVPGDSSGSALAALALARVRDGV